MAIFGIFAYWFSVSAAELHGQVVGVTDGDTVTVLDGQRTQHKIRLAGIDAPEKSQPFGQRAKEHLSSLVFGRAVVVDAEKQDRYHRTVGKVLINGRDANLVTVVAGFQGDFRITPRVGLIATLSDRSVYASQCLLPSFVAKA